MTLDRIITQFNVALVAGTVVFRSPMEDMQTMLWLTEITMRHSGITDIKQGHLEHIHDYTLDNCIEYHDEQALLENDKVELHSMVRNWLEWLNERRSENG